MKRILGIELGSTRIKSVLIDENTKVLAQGCYEWENELVDGLWSYSMIEVEKGVQTSYANLLENYGQEIKNLDAIGVSAMMHGYLVFDKNENLLAPFRTWRNTNAEQAGKELTEKLKFHIPMRWSVSQYYQSVKDGLDHVKDIKFLTTLSGYVHYILTGERVLGVNDASGIFPIKDNDYDKNMLREFNGMLNEKGLEVKFEDLLPKVLVAGEMAGKLTEQGAKWLDKSGKLQAGIPFCAPEGDMGTGMIATNTVGPRTANVSSGTSANLTVVLDKSLEKYYDEIDVIATPDGYPAAMIHTNNCTTEINEWVDMFYEITNLCGLSISKGDLFEKLFNKSLESDEKVGKISAFNFLAGEPLAGTWNGAPMIVRASDGKMNLANFMQAQIYSAISTLSLGMEILRSEKVEIDSVLAHGGFYKTEFIGQNATSAVLNAPVTVMKTASEGGAWGIAVLALYSICKTQPLSKFLDELFSDAEKTTVMATEKEIEKFNNFMVQYKRLFKAEMVASEIMKG